MAAKQVKITKDGLEAQVLEESLKVWERHGWTRAGESEVQGETATPEPEQAPAKKTAKKG